MRAAQARETRGQIRRISLIFTLISGSCLAGAAWAQNDQSPATTASSMSRTARFSLSDERWNSDNEILWPGFLHGLRGFEHFYEPVGQPIYFESPFNTSGIRLLFLHHEFADDSQLQGGHVNVAAVQARLAITERLGFIATKDGYSWLKADALPEEDGWNQIAAGLKYVVIADRENDFVLTPGIRFQTQGGESKVLQNTTSEFSPFVSAAKGWDKLHLIGNFTWRIPTDSDDGNDIVQWDAHLDYEVLPGLAPMIEIHGLHYISDGKALPLSVGGLDYSNIGSSDVSGSTVIWAGAGARWKLNPHISVGGTYEFALTNRNADIMDKRVTLDVMFTW